MEIETNKDFRFAVTTDGILRSLSFTAKRTKKDCYFACRELPSQKHSFHESGIHRLAEHVDFERTAWERADLLELQTGRFVTVARVVFTTEGTWDQSQRGLVPKRCVQLNATELEIVSLGFTPHHPEERPETTDTQHAALLAVDEDKYLSASRGEINLSHFCAAILDHHTPHRTTKFVPAIVPVSGDPTRVDSLLHYRTKHNTFVYWAHHNIPVANVNHVMAHHPIMQALHQGHQLSLAGINIQPSPFGLPQRVHIITS